MMAQYIRTIVSHFSLNVHLPKVPFVRNAQAVSEQAVGVSAFVRKKHMVSDDWLWLCKWSLIICWLIDCQTYMYIGTPVFCVGTPVMYVAFPSWTLWESCSVCINCTLTNAVPRVAKLCAWLFFSITLPHGQPHSVFRGEPVLRPP